MDAIHENGRCAMRGSCGSIFKQLPCPDNEKAAEPDSGQRELLVDVCGSEFAEGPVCCSVEQLEIMKSQFDTAYTLISSCPACRNNFRSFFCNFSCSPNQSTFVNVTLTQPGGSGQPAVKSVDFAVSERFGGGFFDSCKGVLSPGTYTPVIDFIAPGAKDYQGFLAELGAEKPLRSPFQIDFPSPPPPGLVALDSSPRSCNDSDLESLCPCLHCPTSCPVLPDQPSSGVVCQVGSITCLSFILILGYGLAASLYFLGFTLDVGLRRRRDRNYRRLNNVEETDGSLPPSTSSTDGYAESHQLGRGATLLDPTEAVQPRKYRLHTFLRRLFYRIGVFCATHPWLNLFLTFVLIGLLNTGWTRFEVETEPVRLWVAPDSESKLRKEYFDEHFGPFYRTEQIFLVPTENHPTESQPQPALTYERIKWWVKTEQTIRELRSSPNNYGLEDICFAPAGPGTPCVVQSISAWFGNDVDNIDPDTWRDRVLTCAKDSANPDCLPDFMQPLTPEFIIGGIPSPDSYGKVPILESRALVTTFVVAGSLDPAQVAKAAEWETALRAFLVELSATSEESASTKVAFSTEISLEEEISKSTNTDVKIVVLSYIVMFFYIAVALGFGSTAAKADPESPSIRRAVANFFRRRADELHVDNDTGEAIYTRSSALRGFLIGSKFSLALFGMLLVILSIATSFAIFSFLHVKVTLIIAEVIPFLVLAVGVDNIFILVHELERQNSGHGPEDLSSRNGPVISSPTSYTNVQDPSIDGDSTATYLHPEERVARTVAKMGPSILLSSLTQTVAFALGAIVPMPAVRNFALYAAGSVLLNAILQLTALISALTLDLRRLEANRLDIFPCIRLPVRIRLPIEQPRKPSHLLTRLIRRYYMPLLLRKVTKAIVCFVFAGAFILSIISIQHMELGLDQRLALPSESYLIPYFDAMDKYYELGPPVYFVAKEVDVKQRARQQALCAGFTTCSLHSVANRIDAERKRPSISHLAQPAASWIDDFLHWLNPLLECCQVKIADPSVFCNEGDRRCRSCYEGKQPPWNITMNGLPEGEEVMRYLSQWIKSPTTMDCPLGGKASFGSALSFDDTVDKLVASHFRTFNEPLKSQAKFIEAFEAAHHIADEIRKEIGADTFPYSPFYVYFDQYAHIIAIAQEVLGLGLGSTLLITSLLLGSWRTGILVAAVVASTVTVVMGVMSIWGVMLNAISLVNLVISLGIAVEFCSHVARAFMGARPDLASDHPAGWPERDQRIWAAMIDIGPSVLTGVTFTKLIGMAVLAFTRSRLLEIYYFRMWITLIISGALHGLVLLPVMLSLVGGTGYAMDDEDEAWLTKASRRHEYDRPFADDDQASMISQ